MGDFPAPPASRRGVRPAHVRDVFLQVSPLVIVEMVGKTDGTILADDSGSASLTILHAWLDRWQRAGRPGAADLAARLIPTTSADCPGWDLRVSLPAVIPAPRLAVPQSRGPLPEPA
jgi:hypothetical protein